jgi:hypothetical protein
MAKQKEKSLEQIGKEMPPPPKSKWQVADSTARANMAAIQKDAKQHPEKYKLPDIPPHASRMVRHSPLMEEIDMSQIHTSEEVTLPAPTTPVNVGKVKHHMK